MAATPIALRLPPEIWMTILEHAIQWDSTQIERTREMRARHTLLRNTALVSRALTHISRQLLFREVAFGVRVGYTARRSNYTLPKFLDVLDMYAASPEGNDLPARVRTMHIGIGEMGDSKTISGRIVFCTEVEAGRAIELCPNLQYLDIFVGWKLDFTPAHMSFSDDTEKKLKTMQHMRQLHFLLDPQVPDNVHTAPLVFGFLRQFLAAWVRLETLCLEVPPNHNGELDCPDIAHLTELRTCGVPPASLFDTLSRPGHPFTRLVVVEPGLCNSNLGVKEFPEILAIPRGTKELHFVGDFSAYKLDFSRATALRVISWTWKSLVEPEPESLQRISDLNLAPSVDTLLLTPDFIILAFIYSDLDSMLRTLSAHLRHLSKIVMRGPSDILDTYGSTREEIEGVIIQAVISHVTVEWNEEPLFNDWTTLPRLPLR